MLWWTNSYTSWIAWGWVSKMWVSTSFHFLVNYSFNVLLMERESDIVKILHCLNVLNSSSVARGDMFDVPEDNLTSSEPPTEESNMTATTAPLQTSTSSPPISPTIPPDPEAVTCSGRTFDDFMQLKNGSIYAFRGEFRGWMLLMCLFLISSSGWLPMPSSFVF